MPNSQTAHINSMLRQYHDSSSLSRALTVHFLSLGEKEVADFAVALIAEYCAAMALRGLERKA